MRHNVTPRRFGMEGIMGIVLVILGFVILGDLIMQFLRVFFGLLLIFIGWQMITWKTFTIFVKR
ncbi:hypothetical protein D6774_01620 [Candidatus Woesearchaeota archaeon]|nr:MAG: hypothetical protein D6774_01620 [Candidatus Woesearchaeota archaeon]